MKAEFKTLKEIIEECGFPKDTQFLGYVIHLPETDEFLAQFKKIHHDGSNIKMWSKTPGISKKYMSLKRAFKDVKKLKKNVEICALLDTGDAYISQPIT